MNTVEDLKSKVEGNVVSSGDANYDDARSIFNAMIDRKPKYIIYCKNADDVVSAVNFGRENNLRTAIRCGGHNGPGLSLVDDGLVIDLSNMNNVRVDTDTNSVHVDGGCTWGDVDNATHEYGKATVSGIISTTGVGGLALGGGHGYLTRKYGLTVDNLLSAEVVLADGRNVHASEDENSDLFWALRGGGGNFGVVTSFEFRMHPVKNVVAGPTFWPLDELEPTLKWYRDWLPEQPNDVYAFYLTAEVPPGDPFPSEIHNKKVCGLLWCYAGTDIDPKELTRPARDIAEPMFEHVGEMPFPALQSMFDGLYGPGDQWYWKGDFVREISDEAVAVHKKFSEVPTTKSTMHLYPINGAVHNKDVGDTAWSYRDANWSMVIAGVDPDPANSEKITKWSRNYWEAIHPHAAEGAYVNFMMEEGDERVKATYGPNYDRLAKIKGKYDPDNFFNVNQNIKPA